MVDAPACDLLVKLRTQLVNIVRTLLAKFGIKISQGARLASEKAREIGDGGAPAVPREAVKIVGSLSQQR